MRQIIPVILAGGEGKRLWPLSRKSFPKQFIKIKNNLSLFQLTIKRFYNSKICKFEAPIIMTNENYRFFVSQQLEELNIKPEKIFIEPSPKNTAAPILVSNFYAQSKFEDPIILVCPSDHLIKNKSFFFNSIKRALQGIDDKKVITFGIKPTHPETGYGYINISENSEKTKLKKVLNFIEKPNIKDATKMFDSKKYLWNSGIFLFSSDVIISLYKKLCPEMYSSANNSIKKGHIDLNFFRLDLKSWRNITNISIDYAIMEKINNIFTIDIQSKWSDLGDWNSFWENFKSKNGNNYVNQNATAINCKNTLLKSDGNNKHLVGLDLDNIIAVSTSDAVLVADKSNVQNVKKIINNLKNKNIFQAESSIKDYRPWGWFEILYTERSYQVKRLVVKPSEYLSLQKHQRRSEHWIVVSGTAMVTIDKTIKKVKTGESVYIPLGVKHRIENQTESNLIIIEVQTGTYLGEDDIIRFEDKYSRGIK